LKFPNVIKNIAVFTDGGFITADVTFNDGKIAEIAANDKSCDYRSKSKYLIPACTDIHTHGCIGYDFSDADENEIRQMLRWYRNQGTARILATLISDMPQNMTDAAKRIAAVAESQNEDEAEIIGLHLEGPFFAPLKKGAHLEQALCLPSYELLRKINDASGGRVVTVSIDPSLESAVDMISAESKNISFSIGHTACGYDTASMLF